MIFSHIKKRISNFRFHCLLVSITINKRNCHPVTKEAKPTRVIINCYYWLLLTAYRLKWCVYDINYMCIYMHCGWRILVKMIRTVMKQLKQLQTKLRLQQDPTETSDIFLAFLCNCFSCFLTARITLTHMLTGCHSLLLQTTSTVLKLFVYTTELPCRQLI